MARSLLVNGEASIASGTGSAGALEELGISVDGVTMSYETHWEDVKIDTYGPAIAFDKQMMLFDVFIEAELIYYDLDVLEKWLALGSPGLVTTFGTFLNAGELAIAGGLSARLLVRSTPSGLGITGQVPCWNFPHCILVDHQEIKLGTKMNPWKVKWQALPSQQLSTSDGAVIFNELCT